MREVVFVLCGGDGVSTAASAALVGSKDVAF